MIVAGRISWTQYKFRGDSHVLSPDEYNALQQLSSSQLEELLCDIRADRWRQFRDSHRSLLWIAGIAAGCVVFALAVPFFGIIAFFGWVCVLSLGLSAVSRSIALARECRFLRRSHRIAARSRTYESFQQEYLREIADFQLLRCVESYYAVELSGDSDREKHAAQNTFVLLGWPAEWNAAGELVYYPAGNNDGANCVRIRIHSTNLVRIRLIQTSASLKYNSQSKASQEKRIARFNELFQEEFKKFGFVLRDADDAAMAELIPHVALSPYWSRNASGSFSLEYKPRTSSTPSLPT